jgi:COP9 signalosome complex subunit 7
MSSVADLSDGVVLQAYLEMGKAAKENHTLVISFIKQILSQPGVYVFGEVLDMDNVKTLEKGDDNAKQHWELLNIFAYGTYADFKSKQDKLSLVKLTKVQETKLKQLTIVSLASKNRVIPYSVLQTELDVSNVRELEDLIIDSIYQGLLTGKLDQAKSEVQVDETFGRDIKGQDVKKLFSTLDNWAASSDSLMKLIEERLTWASKETKRASQHKDDFAKKLEEMKTAVKAAMEADPSGSDGGAGAFDGDGMDDKRRKQQRTGKGKTPKDGGRPADRHRMGRNM